MNALYHSAFLEALGWSLIDSLWQMGSLWLLYILITGNGKKLNSTYRYSLALIAVISGCLWFFISFGFNYYHLNEGSRVFGLAYLFHGGIPAIDEQKWMPLLSSFYLLFVLWHAARWIFQFTGNRKMYNEQWNVCDKYYESFVNKLRLITGITRNVRIWASEKIASPITFGFLKPVILLPVAALSQLSVKQLEAMIVHEFYHIKRNDYLVNIFMTLCEMMLFFNPFARLLIGNIRRERENCCDDGVINLGYDRWEYAQALYLLGKNDANRYHLALAATGKGKQLLLQRVKRMLYGNHSSPSLFKPLSVFFLCLVVAGSVSREIKKAAPPVVNTVKQNTMIVEVPQDKLIETELPAIQKMRKIPEKRKSEIVTTDVPALQPAPEPVPPHEPQNYENIVVASYVACDQEAIEFCLIEAPVSRGKAPGNAENCDISHPYIPGSTFYFPGHEVSGIEDGKTTVQL